MKIDQTFAWSITMQITNAFVKREQLIKATVRHDRRLPALCYRIIIGNLSNSALYVENLQGVK